MKSSWKTTLAGLLTGGGILFAQQFPQWSKWGLFASGVGAILTGLFARDNDKTSEDVGAGPTSIPARPRSMLAPVLAAGLLPALLTGCTTHVPTTEITFPGGYVCKFPKQTLATNLDLVIGTNGAVRFHADYIEAFNEPNVIAAQGSADAARIKAVSEGAA